MRRVERQRILVCYDVDTQSPEGRRRLRHVATICKDYGQRVQLSLFECSIPPRYLEELRARLVQAICTERDSLRIYHLPDNSKVETYGHRREVDFDDALIR